MEGEELLRLDARPDRLRAVEPGLELRPLSREVIVEHRIAQLEERLLSARVITKKEISKDSVSVGATVRLRDIQANKTVEYHIVGSIEANPAENKLSNESPVGKAIMGRKKGDTVAVVAPRGALKFKILEINAA